MMMGQGPHGNIEMGGMFTVVKVAMRWRETGTRAGIRLPRGHCREGDAW